MADVARVMSVNPQPEHKAVLEGERDFVLAGNLDDMPSFAATRGRMFDMFPHTGHTEMLVRREGRSG